MKDDVPEDVKKRRLREIIDTFYTHVKERNMRLVDSYQLLLVEGVSLYLYITSYSCFLCSDIFLFSLTLIHHILHHTSSSTVLKYIRTCVYFHAALHNIICSVEFLSQYFICVVFRLVRDVLVN